MRKILVLAVFAGLLAGCSTSPVSLSQAQKVPGERMFAYQQPGAEPYGTVTVTRDSGVMGSGCLAGFYVDGKVVGKFETSETATFYLPVGDYIFGAGFPEGKGMCAFHDGEAREVDAKVVGKSVKYYRIVTRANEAIALEPTTFR